MGAVDVGVYVRSGCAGQSSTLKATASSQTASGPASGGAAGQHVFFGAFGRHVKAILEGVAVLS